MQPMIRQMNSLRVDIADEQTSRRAVHECRDCHTTKMGLWLNTEPEHGQNKRAICELLRSPEERTLHGTDDGQIMIL